jgi:hypothetical protein
VDVMGLFFCEPGNWLLFLGCHLLAIRVMKSTKSTIPTNIIFERLECVAD